MVNKGAFFLDLVDDLMNHHMIQADFRKFDKPGSLLADWMRRNKDQAKVIRDIKSSDLQNPHRFHLLYSQDTQEHWRKRAGEKRLTFYRSQLKGV